MHSEDIEKFFSKKALFNKDFVKVSFKGRDAIFGLFIQEDDYAYLKGKNFWRIVPRSKLDDYRKSHNGSLAKIFNGASFSKLSTYTESFEDRSEATIVDMS